MNQQIMGSLNWIQMIKIITKHQQAGVFIEILNQWPWKRMILEYFHSNK